MLNRNTSLWAEWRVPLCYAAHRMGVHRCRTSSILQISSNKTLNKGSMLSFTYSFTLIYEETPVEKKFNCPQIRKKTKNHLILLYIKFIATPFCLTQAQCSHSYGLELMLKLLMLFFKLLQSPSLFFSPTPRHSNSLLGLALKQLLLFPTPVSAFFLSIFRTFSLI